VSSGIDQPGFEPGVRGEPTRRALFDIKRDLGKRVSTIEDSTPGEPNGFENRSDCTLTFSNATRTLTLTGNYTFFGRGNKFTKRIDSFQISDTEGDHYVYYDINGRLAEYTTFNPDLIGEDCFVAYIYWDATNKEAVPWSLCEQHGSSMSAVTHSYLHNTRGAAYDEGILPAVISINGTGNSDDNARFTTTSGVIWDEDIRHTILARTATSNIPYLYRLGANGNWRMNDDNAFVVRKGTNRALWNQFTGGAWQLTELANNQFVLSHLYAIPGVNETNGSVILIAGQASYGNANAARTGALTELQRLALDGLPSPEFVPVATFICQTATAYSNSVSTRIITTDEGDDYIDWRGSTLAGGGGNGPDLVLSNANPQQVALTTPLPGTSPEVSRADHVHASAFVQSSSTPQQISQTAASAGTSSDVSRADHVHLGVQQIRFCTPTRAYDVTAAAGTVTVTLGTTVGGVSLTGATGVFMATTAVSTGTAGSINVFPQSVATQPGTSNANFNATSGNIGNGFAFTELDSSRRFKLHRTANVRAILDVMGFSFS
jgi:hypothetical protein